MITLHWLSCHIYSSKFFKIKNCLNGDLFVSCDDRIGKMLHSICISAVAMSLRWATRGPWASCWLFCCYCRHGRRVNSLCQITECLLFFRIIIFYVLHVLNIALTGLLRRGLVSSWRSWPHWLVVTGSLNTGDTVWYLQVLCSSFLLIVISFKV